MSAASSTRKDVLIVRPETPSELVEAFAAAHLERREHGRCILPVSSRAVADRLRETAEFLGLPWTLVDRAPAPYRSDERVVRALATAERHDATAARLGALFEALCPERFAHVRGRGDPLASFADVPVVLAIGEGLDAGARFALCTRRALVHVDTPEDAEHAFERLRTARSIYVAPRDDFDVDALRGLLAAKRASATAASLGFLYPFGDFEREFFAMKSVLFEYGHADRGRPYAFFFSLEPKARSFSVDRARFVVGRGGDVEHAARILEEPAEFLFSTPHSNGMDMALGEVVLCSREDRTSAEAPRRAMPCFFEDSCSRKRPNNRLLGPSRVKSAVAFLYTCWGVLLRNGVYDVEASLGRSFAISPYTGALLTTYAMSFLDRAAGFFVAEAYSRGIPLGEVTRRFNERHFARFDDHAQVAVLFGDPELRVASPQPLDLTSASKTEPELARFVESVGVDLYPVAPEAESRPSRKSDGVPRLVPDAVFAATDFTRCAVHATRDLRMPKLQASLDALAEANERLAMFGALFNGRRRQEEKIAFPEALMLRRYDDVLSRYHRAWHDMFLAMVSNLGGYVRLQIDPYFLADRHDDSGDSRNAPHRCPYCGASTWSSRMSMIGSPRVTRTLLECFNCATIRDGSERDMSATLVCEERWRLGEPVRVAIDVQGSSAPAPLDVQPYAATVILEPFTKRTGTAAHGSARGTRSSHDTRIALDDWRLDERYRPGSHHLNAIVSLGADLLFLRRTIYLDG